MEGLKKILPDIQEVNFSEFEVKKKSVLVLVLGFEERSINFLKQLNKEKGANTLNGIIIIRYKPSLKKNDKYKKEISDLINLLKIDKKNVTELCFDRSYPLDFDVNIKKMLSNINNSSHVYCDISGMSKLLMLFILKALWSIHKAFSIIYSEAKIYAPTKQQYLEIKEAEQSNLNEFFPLGVFDPFIPPSFSGLSPLGVDRILIGFLSYNKRQSLGATNIIPYQNFIPFIGVPPVRNWTWRTEALIEINNEGLLASHKYISETFKIEFNNNMEVVGEEFDLNQEYSVYLSTFDYKTTLEALDWVSKRHRYKHFITIAPFGSKLQTLGIFLFYMLNPETQIVYSSPQDYYDNYSKGVKKTFIINFEEIRNLEVNLKRIVDPNYSYLEKMNYNS